MTPLYSFYAYGLLTRWLNRFLVVCIPIAVLKTIIWGLFSNRLIEHRAVNQWYCLTCISFTVFSVFRLNWLSFNLTHLCMRDAPHLPLFKQKYNNFDYYNSLILINILLITFLFISIEHLS